MKAKLIKTENGYGLKDCELIAFVSTVRTEHRHHKLSLKNCQAIERGYDLDELVEEECNNPDLSWENDYAKEKYKAGFQKALEILGDKKFSEKELTMLFAYGHQIGMNSVLAIQSQHSPQPMPKPDSDKLRDELIQSIQQNEWDVEIIEEPVDLAFYENGNKYPINVNLPDRFKYKPKLDAENCLILKRL